MKRNTQVTTVPFCNRILITKRDRSYKTEQNTLRKGSWIFPVVHPFIHPGRQQFFSTSHGQSVVSTGLLAAVFVVATHCSPPPTDKKCSHKHGCEETNPPAAKWKYLVPTLLYTLLETDQAFTSFFHSMSRSSSAILLSNALLSSCFSVTMSVTFKRSRNIGWRTGKKRTAWQQDPRQPRSQAGETLGTRWVTRTQAPSPGPEPPPRWWCSTGFPALFRSAVAWSGAGPAGMIKREKNETLVLQSDTRASYDWAWSLGYDWSTIGQRAKHDWATNESRMGTTKEPLRYEWRTNEIRLVRYDSTGLRLVHEVWGTTGARLGYEQSTTELRLNPEWIRPKQRCHWDTRRARMKSLGYDWSTIGLRAKHDWATAEYD